MKFLVHTRTIFKALPVPASELSNDEKFEVPAGATFVSISDSFRIDNGHYLVYFTSELGSGANRRQGWFVPRVHVEILSCIARVKTNNLNLRKFPNPKDKDDQSIIHKLELGTLVNLFDATYIKDNSLWWYGSPLVTANKEWFQDPQTGWMSSKYLEIINITINDI
ncbi:MAG TPA: hypothetical protein DCQ51_16600 [Planktothrix sp. UBA8407]|jgi:hypothetical protein|nr:hypothetical protein [Planktothrix sp. UBA8402]HAO12739.1 hypothetical protein [Planktothrix sp. UBA8407]HBK24967.1 hypothetical protein [Planktothrix sp. UBA10369]